VGPQDPKDVTRNTIRDLSGVVKELAALNGDAHYWLAPSTPHSGTGWRTRTRLLRRRWSRLGAG
jgi:hypothetical protein